MHFQYIQWLFSSLQPFESAENEGAKLNHCGLLSNLWENIHVLLVELAGLVANKFSLTQTSIHEMSIRKRRQDYSSSEPLSGYQSSSGVS